MSVTLTRADQVSYLEFKNEKANCLSSEMLDNLSKSIDNLKEDTKVLVIRSEGEKVFSAGANFDEFKKIKTKEEALNYFSGFIKVLNSIRKASCIVICRVHGKAVGGAVGLIAACDYVFALEKAEVKLSELDIGIGPFTISPAVERKIGKSYFSEMLYDTEWKDSSWAKKVGLFNKLFKDHKTLDASVKEFADKLCKQNKSVLTENRKLLWYGTDDWPELMLERARVVSELLVQRATSK